MKRCIYILLATVLFVSNAYSGDYKVTYETDSDLVNAKIDSRIFDAFSKKSATLKKQSLIGSLESNQGIRVLINLKKSQQFEGLRNIKNRKHRLVKMASMIKDHQNNFLNTLSVNDTSGKKNRFKTAIKLRYQNTVAAYVSDTEALEKIASRSDVESLQIDKLNELFTVEGRHLTSSNAAANLGFTGTDIGVAVVDTHFDLLHPELGGSTYLPNSVVMEGKNFSDPGEGVHSRNMEDCYHGTGTASIVTRYAPDAKIYALTVFPNAYDSVIADAIEWVVENKDGVNGGPAIKIISMSLGGGQYSGTCNSGVIHDAAGNALDNGILVFAASGNNGWSSSISNPACSDNVISIGSVWDEDDANYTPFEPANCSDNNRYADERTCYSNTSPVLDLYSPSEEVVCAMCGGGTWTLGGTSSATPAAAGLTAQLLQAKPELMGDKEGVVSLYQETGVEVMGDESKRRIDLEKALGGIETNPPVVDSTEIIDGDQSVTYVVTASDPDGNLDNIQIYMDGSQYKIVSADSGDTQTFNEVLRFVDLDPGQHCLTAKAFDTTGKESELSSENCFISIEIPKNPPSIEVQDTNVTGLNVTISGVASDIDDNLMLIEVEIDNSGIWEVVSGTDNWSYSASLDAGTHTVIFRATDDTGLSTITDEISFTLEFICRDYEATNSEHQAAGRAYTSVSGGWWWYGGTTTWYTEGSDESLGTSGSDITTVMENPEGYYSIGECPEEIDPVAPTIVSYEANTNGNSLTVTGTASDGNNNLKEIIITDIDTEEEIACSGTESFTCEINGLSLGIHKYQLQAFDTTDLSSAPTAIIEVEITDEPHTCITATNYEHVQAGRAYEEFFWFASYAYANGSNDSLGYTGNYFYSTVTSLQQESANYWVLVSECN